MTEIEDEIKELEDMINNCYDKTIKQCSKEFPCDECISDVNFLKGLKKGVEMAQKETAKGIFTDLEKLYKKYEEDGSPPVVCLPEDCGDISGLSAVSEYWDIKKKWLGEKSK